MGGVLIEFVRACDGRALSPAYAHALAAWAREQRLLLFDDSVLLGLRCGSPSASFLYGIACHWVAVGKLYGFSGVVQNLKADHYGGYESDASFLNGYITCNISPLEVLRCRVALAAIAKRRLWRNAQAVGPRLIRRLRAQGLDAWGVGLAIWWDSEGGGGVQNATALHSRMLPPLTLSAAEAAEVVARVGLFSHLPSLLNSALGRMQAAHPPPWGRPREVIRWHARSIADDDRGIPSGGGATVAARPEEQQARPAVGRPKRRIVAWGKRS